MLPGSMVEEADLLTSAFTMSILMAVVNTPLNGLVSMEVLNVLKDAANALDTTRMDRLLKRTTASSPLLDFLHSTRDGARWTRLMTLIKYATACAVYQATRGARQGVGASGRKDGCAVESMAGDTA
ncbi:uncharacterized protein ARMOST_12324 [Armillaria ostoyae]|uniref:Uncharacterized protein n=1 Tax=Armillaria ostoyae TaxID=47428 RepID=A0A284RJK2_ARMOS|nr:uncharacterized protein ARMOST_12324 [Armillaria ostoyae]